MEISITARNIDIDDSLKKYIHKRIGKFRSLYKRIYKCEVILSSEKERKNIEIILSLKRNRIVATESSPDIITAVDMVVEKIKKQLRKINGKISSKRRKTILKRIVSPVSSWSWFDSGSTEE